MSIKNSNKNQKRLKILPEDEVNDIYEIPHFTIEDQAEYFLLSQPEKDIIKGFKSVNSKIYFILQLGYFKAKKMFFSFDFKEVKEDVIYIKNQYFTTIKNFKLNLVDKKTKLYQQKTILSLLNYKYCHSEIRQKLYLKACNIAKLSGKPVFIFRELIKYLSENDIILPGYSFMQELIGQAILFEENRLIEIMKNYLSDPDIEKLKLLLEDSSRLHKITALKHEPKDFSLGEIKSEIERKNKINHLYSIICNLLPILAISNESVQYYASLVDYYSVYKLKRFNVWTGYLYLLCYIYYRYNKIHDNLINSLIFDVRKYNDEARFIAKEKVLQFYSENKNSMKKIGELIKIFTNDNINPDTPFKEIQTLAFSILEKQQIMNITEEIADELKFDESIFQWEHIDNISRKFKRHLRQIVLSVNFLASSVDDPLIEAINFLKTALKNNKPLSSYKTKEFPNKIIQENIKKYFYKIEPEGTKTIIADRYEFLIYRLLRNRLEAGEVFCRESQRFRSFEDDLIDDKTWKNKENLILEAGLSIFKIPIKQHLSELQNELEKDIILINKNINSGENKHFQHSKRGISNRWVLEQSNDSEEINHPFFDSLEQVELRNILHYANENTMFMDLFEHILGRYSKQIKDNKTLIACLIAWGTNMGLYRMGQISDIPYSVLSSMSDNFIRLETLKAANDCISNAISKLSIFRQYHIGNSIHSSSDGQKFETRINTINSRHSPKYFGLRKGIVSYALVANHIPLNATIIGANEHESHYVFDILFNNSTNIKPDIHSTDTHGANEVNFAILNFFGYQFAPRYKSLYEKVSKSFYSFKHPSHYENLIIKPIRKINTDLIIEEWENIQRIIVSLAHKTTTQNIIIGKLSSYKRKNKTKQALWEYDNIIKSLYFLNYIDSIELRSNVQYALNRGESYHKLRRAISYANFGKLKFRTQQDQNLWSECSRLLSNCIIYYNASILSNVLNYRKSNNQNTEDLKYISSVAWQHINLYGRYEFKKSIVPIDIESIIEKLNHL